MRPPRAAAGLLLALAASQAAGYWPFPLPPPPEAYGGVLIDRVSGQNGVLPVGFSHWVHRRKHTCRVCHLELEFRMEANASEITEEASRAGRFCGACHDGKAVFGHAEGNCDKCHSGRPATAPAGLLALADFPKARYGNRIDWSAALEEKWIDPVRFLSVPPLPDEVTDQSNLEMDETWGGIPPTVFPHRRHTEWLDCGDCHPVLFNVRLRSSGVSMTKIRQGEFCGQCHGAVAFPLTDCRRCHPRMEGAPRYPEPVSDEDGR